MEKETRTLTDDDVKALVDEMESRLEKSVGRGMISLLWKAALLGFLIVAGIGFFKWDKML